MPADLPTSGIDAFEATQLVGPPTIRDTQELLAAFEQVDAWEQTTTKRAGTNTDWPPEPEILPAERARRRVAMFRAMTTSTIRAQSED